MIDAQGLAGRWRHRARMFRVIAALPPHDPGQDGRLRGAAAAFDQAADELERADGARAARVDSRPPSDPAYAGMMLSVRA